MDHQSIAFTLEMGGLMLILGVWAYAAWMIAKYDHMWHQARNAIEDTQTNGETEMGAGSGVARQWQVVEQPGGGVAVATPAVTTPACGTSLCSSTRTDT